MSIEYSVTPLQELGKVAIIVKNGNIKEESILDMDLNIHEDILRIRIESELRNMKAKVQKKVNFYNKVYTIGKEVTDMVKLEK